MELYAIVTDFEDICISVIEDIDFDIEGYGKIVSIACRPTWKTYKNQWFSVENGEVLYMSSSKEELQKILDKLEEKEPK